MVVTRSQSKINNSLVFETMSDSESYHSIPEVLSRVQMIDFEDGEILNRNRGSGNDSIERRFSGMNSQISELTNIVLSLTESSD